jgi:hypothetical protein
MKCAPSVEKRNCDRAWRIVVAVAGPIVAGELDAFGARVNVTPHDNTFFMKPLVRELAAALTKGRKG